MLVPSDRNSTGQDSRKSKIMVVDDETMVLAAIRRIFENEFMVFTFESSEKALAYHLMKHGNGRTAEKYIEDATVFFKKNRDIAEPTILQSGSKGFSIKTKVTDTNGNVKRIGGFFTIARAIAILCFCPPLSDTPFEPTSVK